MTDKEIRDVLTHLDNSDREVSSWEANFLESVLHKWDGPLSEGQRTSAERMIERYGYNH